MNYTLGTALTVIKVTAHDPSTERVSMSYCLRYIPYIYIYNFPFAKMTWTITNILKSKLQIVGCT